MSEGTAFEVLILGASAGGEMAFLTLLRELPPDFAVPIVLMQHLSPESAFVDTYAPRTPFALEWAGDRSTLAAGKVLVCPPRTFVELLPDGSLQLLPCEGGALQKPIDRLLQSAARSHAQRAIGVVLTGMGSDGAAGARELHLAGGQVLVQSEASAQYPDMPRAAIAAGAANLVVPLRDIAQVITELVAGTPRPKARSELQAIERVFGSKGDIAALAREVDWSRTPVGPVLEWPAELRLMARTAMESPYPMAVWWGPELVQLYNEPWRRFLGVSKHPEALGRPARETWPEIWSDIGPMVERVMQQGVPVGGEDFLMVIDRHGYAEEVFINFAYSPIRDAGGAVVGVHNTGWETTQRVVAERRLSALHVLAERLKGADTPRQACEQAAAALGFIPLDLPFALLYLFDAQRRQALLAGAAGLPAGSSAAPHTWTADGPRDAWPLQRLLDTDAGPDSQGAGVLLDGLARRLPELPSLVGAHAGKAAPAQAFLLPLRLAADAAPIGALVAGLSPQRPFDDDYRSFLGLVAQHVNAGLVEARARQLERERLERLAEIDRAKTEFFANVSHEFRTPLTLLLGPLEELQRRREELPADLAGGVDAAARNSRRLLRLVNDLLDFSQIEARGQHPVLEPADLSALTCDIASAFRSAIESAGLELRMSCPPDLPLVPVNREMWEKVVSNLLANALKFSFKGAISVTLRALSLHAEVVVSDTGIGIPRHELPNLFKRFHRVRGAKARTVEGSGIGLSIVQDLVSRMGGQLRVHSIEHLGTTFTIWMPFRSVRQTLESAVPAAAHVPAMRLASELADEAARWTRSPPEPGPATVDEMLGLPDGERLRGLAPGARVLVADDNADMREYLRRLLGRHWGVSVVADGAAALAAVRRERPDLVLADVMMPGLDGFALLRAVRADDGLRHTPVVLLTARTGEDAAIEGLLAGADDYLVKPFSARELVARVGGQLELSRSRRRAEEVNTFLVRFSDQVRGLKDAHAVAQAACRMALDHLGAERAWWAELEEGAREYLISATAYLPDVAAPEGRQALDAWEPFASLHLAGKPAVVDDTQADPRISAGVKEACARAGAGATVAAPVVVEGRLRCALAVSQHRPRRWTPEEVALVQGIAVRCWAEVERARAEAALWESERVLRRGQAWLAAQKEAFEAAMNGLPLAASLGILARAASEQLDSECRCAFFIADAGGSGLRHVVGMPESYGRRVDGIETAPEAEACALAAASGAPVLTADVLEEPRWQDWTSLALEYGYRGCWVFPVTGSSGRLVGSLAMYWKEPREPGARELELAATLTRSAGVIISRR